MERKENFPRIRAVLNCLDSMFHNCKMRLIKDANGNILASYTYNFRKNPLEEKTMFLDAFVRNRKNPQSKNIINEVYQDMKNIALRKKAKELTLFSKVNDTNLRKKYETLGFQIDNKTYIEKAYFMKVRTDDFLKNQE